jgi:hypothetical protein
MTKLCARGKAAAKRKFKVYPSAYANAYASKICAGKIKDPSGVKRKDWGPKKASEGKFFHLDDEGKKYGPKTFPFKSNTPVIDPKDLKKRKKVISAYTGKAVKQTSETQKEFKMRHEYHTGTKGMMDYYKDIV